MRFFATSLALLTIVTGARLASAQTPALDDSTKSSPTRTTDPNAAPDTLATAADKVSWGVDVRLRSVYVITPILGLFVDRNPGGSQNYGFGVDLVRKKGDNEAQFGIEYEHVNAAPGVWINKGDTVPQDVADYILSPDDAGHQFGWLTLEASYFFHKPFNKYVSLRYGGGIGLGIVTGELDYYKVQCAAGATNSNPEPGCVPARFNGTAQYTDINGNVLPSQNDPGPFKYNTPPVFPVLNAIIGVQIHPTDKAYINIEGGLRTLFFFGLSAGYFFN